MRNIFRNIYAYAIKEWGLAGIKKYLANTGWLFLGQMFYLLVAFFIGAWLARYLGPTNYGVVNYTLAFVGLFTFISNLGIGTILSRDLITHPEQEGTLLGSSFALLTAGSVAAFVAIAISASIFEPTALARHLIIFYAATFLWSPLGIINIYFQSTVQAKKTVRVSIIATTISSLLKIALILTGKGVIFVIAIFMFESLLNAVLSIVIYKTNGHKFRSWRFDPLLAKQLLSGGVLLMLAAGASFILTRIDQVMVRAFLGEAAVGQYAAGVRLVEVWYFVPSIISSSLFPAIVNAKRTDEAKYRKRVRNLYALLFGTALAIAIPSTVLAPYVIHLLFGAQYEAAIAILRIYVWSGVGLFLLWGMQQFFLSENRLWVIFSLYLFAMSLNVALNFVLIPKIGLDGAAWSTLISYVAAPIVGFIIMSRDSRNERLRLSTFSPLSPLP